MIYVLFLKRGEYMHFSRLDGEKPLPDIDDMIYGDEAPTPSDR